MATEVLRRHAVTAYYVLTFAISWGLILLVLGPGAMTGTGATIAAAGALALAGPSISGVLLTWLLDGRAGLARLFERLRRWRVGGRWYAVALLTGPLVMLATLAALRLVPAITTADDKLGPVMLGLSTGLTVCFFEELGWTGFVLPRMRKRHGVFATGWLMGLLWSVWHFPFFAGTRDPSGAVPTALIVAVLLFAWLPPYRMLMVWVYDRTESLLLAMVMHLPIVVAQYVLAIEGLSAVGLVTQLLSWGVAFWALVAIVALASRRRVSRRPLAPRRTAPA